ncbi:toprim domain-containing protein [Candidatus Woesearchaeota archaeon]|nr:toprim domain-containing protein [Candidatus Woesearchaeota archaeon]
MSNQTYSDIIKAVDIRKELKSRGIEGNVSNDNLMIKCPFHGDRNPSMGIKLTGDKKGLFRCMTWRCSEKGNFIKLIAELDGISYKKALRLFGKGFKKISLKKIKEQFITGLKGRKSNGKIKFIKKKILEEFKAPYGKYLKYLTGSKRKLTKDSIKKFNILCSDSGFWQQRVIIPIYNNDERLVSLAARHISTDDKRKKVRKLKGSDRSKILYGMHTLKSKKRLVIVEGEFDVIYLQQFNIPAVSLGTTTVSSYQKKEIIKNCDKVYISLDGDVDKQGIAKLKKQLDEYVSVEVIKLPGKQDPNSLTKKQVRKYYKTFFGRKK